MDLEPGGEGGRERPRVPDLLERDEDDIGVARGAVPERLGRQPALARAARADERDQPRPPQQGRQLGQLALAADEAGPGHRQRAGGVGVGAGSSAVASSSASAASDLAERWVRPDSTG